MTKPGLALDRTCGLTLLVAIVFLSGLGVAVAAAFSWHHEDVSWIAAVSALAAAAEASDFSIFPGSRVSIGMALVIAAGIFSGLPGAAVVSAVVAGVDFAAHRKAAKKAAFNCGTLLLSAATFVGVIRVFEASPDPGDWTALLGPVVAGSVAAFAANSSLVAAAISLERGRAWWQTWREAFLWMLPHYVVLGTIALLAAATYDRWEMWGLALAIVPLAMAWLIMKQYAERVSGVSGPPRAA